jgi:hypothetical protein
MAEEGIITGSSFCQVKVFEMTMQKELFFVKKEAVRPISSQNGNTFRAMN